MVSLDLSLFELGDFLEARQSCDLVALFLVS